MEGVFVTGTGTGVGKTIVAGVLARTAADAGQRVGVFKPAVSGLDEAADELTLPDHEHLRLAARSDQTDEEITPYRYGPAVSPHLAAAEAGEEISVTRLRGAVAEARAGSDTLVCEGVGGLLVPLRPDYLVRDFARDVGMPLVVAAWPGLGAINHTLLTLEAARAATLDVAAVVLTPWPDRPGALETSNRETIERIGAVEVLTLGPIDPNRPESWPSLGL